MISIRQIQAEATYPLRKKELRDKIDLPEKFTGDNDDTTFHFGLYKEKKLLSIVSYMKSENENLQGNQYQLRGMATQREFQYKGYGKILINNTEKILRNKNIEIIWCNARVVALNFYQKLGFKIIGSEFKIPQIGGHFVMYKYLL